MMIAEGDNIKIDAENVLKYEGRDEGVLKSAHTGCCKANCLIKI